MLLSREFGVRLGEAGSHPEVARRRRPTKVGSWLLDPRFPAASPGTRYAGGDGDFRMRTSSRDLIVQIGGYSHENELDLALMVGEFWESGSGSADSRYSSDSDSGFSDLAHLAEKVLLHKRGMTPIESDLQSLVHSLLFSVSEVDLYLIKEEQCNASCIRESLAKLLKLSGYDAAVCSSKWQGTESIDKVPGGEHEYVDVVLSDSQGSERLIIDIDFRSHFEIARAVASYDALLRSLPVVYVGTLPRLAQFLQVMVDAAKFSLKQNSMPLPPWRSLTYLQAKWCSNYERKLNIDVTNQSISSTDHRQCVGHLESLKTSLKFAIESERLLKPIANEKKRMKSERGRLSLLCS
ncbi:uncharacterized protein LOC121998125 [Zingiber officinale]|uniref:Uncharacterized protein n=2 Tax=Zingiber officinale TaxID=94328 RepID=A0A8J5GIV1_ZINOF|nr:uncharacterized protein LOC121989176 isoform X1 [Zingiber officinale]XP_042408818.1 uncharacterized protein LOC121998125 [Zingiber officinale]KAG6497695.1 hypothetical protein ZIOFF_045599 [Zingiber officinale]KAG6501662.1 hypothetical protein ZIOFF_041545 [Zingiber officinale]